MPRAGGVSELLSLLVLSAVVCPGIACDREEPDLLARLASAPVTERDRLLREAIAANGGTPIVRGDAAYFFFERPEGPPPRLVADFNGWGQYADATMDPLEGTGWYYTKAKLHPSARIEYAIALPAVDDGNLAVDPENPHRVQSLSRPYSELRMPGYSDPPELELDSSASLPHGRLVETEIESRIRKNRRQIFVYLPPGYDDSEEKRYPTAYFGDGSNYVSNLPVAGLLDYAIARGGVAPLVAVFVEPKPRSEEYEMNDDYRRFVVEELVPWVDATYRTIEAPEARAILGSSRGALAAIDLAWFHDDVFRSCGAIAPATSPLEIIDMIGEGDVKPLRFFVLVGLYDFRWRPDGLELRDTLRARGYDLAFLEIPEGHSPHAWSPYIDDVLRHLFPAEPAGTELSHDEVQARMGLP